MLTFLSRPIYGAIAVFLVSFVVYLLTLASGVGFIDAGELATVASTLGIAHPTGYPLFTLVGFLFSQLPIAETIIMRLNIMSALFSALGAGAVVFLGHEIHGNWLAIRSKVKEKAKKKGVELESANTTGETKQHQAVAAGILGGLIMAFSETWWGNATSIEVYPLHVFLLPVVLTFFLRMLREGENPHAKRDAFLFALTLGLAFSNHLTTILLAPACLYMFFARFGVNAASFKRIVRLIPAFALGLTPYLYLLLRSSSEPLMDWGNPENLGNFMKHVTGGQYKIWMFTGSNAGKQFGYFWNSLPSEFSWLHIILALVAIPVLAKVASRQRAHIFPFLLLLFFTCILYAINYDIHDIDSYFLLAYLAFGLIVSAFWGLFTRYENNFTKRLKSTAITTLWFAGLYALLQIVTIYPAADESGNHMVDDYTHNMLTNLPPNAIVFSSAWDFWVSGSFYWQHIEKLRPDVTVIDVALLRDRPWYYAHLKQVAPDVLRNAQKELDAFMPHLVRFDRGEPIDAAAISTTYRAFTEALVRNNSSRPIFVTSDMLSERDELFAPSFRGIPAGLAFRFVDRDTVFSTEIPKIVWHDETYTKRNYYTDNARLLQATALASTGSSLAQQGQLPQAKAFLDLAAQFAPDPKVDITKLNQRDREFAQMVDTRFAELETMRRQLR
jgi:hypothetical protein